jgi:hypothetical protein
LRKFEACRFIEKKWAFLGYCWLETEFELNLLFRIINTGQSVDSLIESSIEISPHFLMSYTFSPTHTPGIYDTYNPRHFKGYRIVFRKNQLEAVRTIETFMAAIEKRDPNSVVIVLEITARGFPELGKISWGNPIRPASSGAKI